MHVTKKTVKMFDEATETEHEGFIVTVHTHKGERIIIKVVDDDTQEVLQKERIATHEKRSNYHCIRS